MRKVLIALHSDDLSSVLQEHLEAHFSVACCQDGKTALMLLEQTRPEILILDLSLPELDGITLLEQAHAFRPPIIMAIIKQNSPYVLGAAPDVGIGYMMMIPINIQAMITRLLDMVNRYNKTRSRQEASETQTSQMLRELNFAPNLDGHQYLQAAIPVFAEDPSQRICKELYPAVAKLLGIEGKNNIERSIRSSIEKAWARRDAQIWEHYFPAGSAAKPKRPSNKLFISRMAEELKRK